MAARIVQLWTGREAGGKGAISICGCATRFNCDDSGPPAQSRARAAARSNGMPTEQDVRRALRKVKDPELNLDLVVLGLIYDIEIADSHVKTTMSLTSPFCPVAGQIVDEARAAIEAVPGVESADVELTFSPQWTPDRIDPLIRSSLGL
jgi:metal-sulfur cluster biosynthetic enzyme